MSKKKKIIIITSLLVAVILTISGAFAVTFAKFTSSGSGANNTASVAKWGIKITASGNLFATAYGGTLVSSSTTDKVLAHGTSGTLSNCKITGTPEVASQVTYNATVNLNGDWTDGNGAYYCPLIVTLKKGSTTVATLNGTSYASASAFAADIKAKIESNFVFNFTPNQVFDSSFTSPSITWEWPANVNAEKDSALYGKATKPSIATDITINVRQVTAQFKRNG